MLGILIVWIKFQGFVVGFQRFLQLTQLGMGIAFSGEADFSGMTDAGPLFISRVIHEAMLDVDENGTEAAAATAVTLELTAEPNPPQPPAFTADRPFFFLIRHEQTGSLLFVGRVADPTRS